MTPINPESPRNAVHSQITPAQNEQKDKISDQSARLSQGTTPDLKEPSSTSVMMDVQSRADALAFFKADIIDRYELEQYSPMPTAMIMAPLKAYSPSEIMSFATDFHRLKATIDTAAEGRKIDMTAGTPGSGKTSLFEEIAQRNNAALLDFDKVALKGLTLFNQSLEQKSRTPEAAYHYFRGASQTIHNWLLAYAISQNKNIALSITNTSPFFGKTIEFFKQHGYDVELHHITCPLQECFAANNHRQANGIFQCSTEDIQDKGEAFYQKTSDYLQCPQVHYWYRPTADSAPQLAARQVNGQLMLTQFDLMNSLVTVHTQDNTDSGEKMNQFFYGKP